MRVKIPSKNPLTDLLEFAEKNRASAIFREISESKIIYYLIKPDYYFSNRFEGQMEELQFKLFPENNTLILCTSKSRDDPIWAKSERVYWQAEEN